MKRIQLKLMLIAVFSLALAITACKKDETTQVAASDTSSSEYDALAENIFTDVTNISNEAYDLGTTNFKSGDDDSDIIGQCATITFDTTAFPRELIIDFGEENCLCRDGKYRRGKIINTFTGRYKKPGTIITLGFEDFYVNDNHVEGSRVVTNMGFNDDENMYWTIEVESLITLAGDATSETSVSFGWNSSRVREWIEGSDTYERWDDVFLTTGMAEGVRPSGLGWTREIIIPLRKQMSCRFIVSGSIEIQPEDMPLRLLDFGDGECDNIATITVDGQTHTIHLH